MSVYIDGANILWRGKQWCHVYADSLQELEDFARKVGLKPEWLQNQDGKTGLPHYDVTGIMNVRCHTFGAIKVGHDNDPYRELRRAQVRGEYPMALAHNTGFGPTEGEADEAQAQYPGRDYVGRAKESSTGKEPS